ncbi:MAG: hypothetical protein CVU69_11630 [Deltaproteobacteria bacterium HGW-Deltaproteobacteria-4]|nr:MAG: hypothetical protein CVU69_11630 [Deltaproteobacteria bacterium HGW-Deltaproteobacteria-4]
MDGISWIKILSIFSLASLLLPGCGGGGSSGGGPGAAPITTPAQAQQAAASFLLVRGDGLSNLISSPAGVGSSAKIFTSRIVSENLPDTESSLAIQKFLAKSARAMTVQKYALTITNCSVFGTITEDYIEKPDGGGFKRTTTYDECREDSLLINGTYSLEEIYDGATSQSIVIEGNGDQDVNDETDFVIQELDSGGLVVATRKASGTDYWTETVVTDTPTLFASHQSSSFKGMYTYSDAADTFSFTVDMTDTGTSKNTLNGGVVTHTEEEFVSNGTMAFSGTFSGESVGLIFTANQLKTKDVYDLNATGETGLWEASGSFATVMTPATCLAGSYTIKTIKPIEYTLDYSSGEETTSSGEIELNSAARILLSNNGADNIVTIYLGTNPTPVFTGTEESLAAATLEACPIFGLAGGL